MIVEFVKKYKDSRRVFSKGKQIRLSNELANELIEKGICKELSKDQKDTFVKVENDLRDKNLE